MPPQATPGNEKSNAYLLKIIIGLLSISATLFGIIGNSVLARLEKLENKMDVFAQAQAVDHASVLTVQDNVRWLQSESRDHTENYFRLAQLAGLKAEEVTYKPKRR